MQYSIRCTVPSWPNGPITDGLRKYIAASDFLVTLYKGRARFLLLRREKAAGRSIELSCIASQENTRQLLSGIRPKVYVYRVASYYYQRPDQPEKHNARKFDNEICSKDESEAQMLEETRRFLAGFGPRDDREEFWRRLDIKEYNLKKLREDVDALVQDQKKDEVMDRLKKQLTSLAGYQSWVGGKY